MRPYLLVFVIAAITTYLLTFLARKVSWRIGAVTMPSERHVHTSPTATGGGMAMFGALAITLIIASAVPAFDDVFAGSSEALGIALGAAVMFVVGFVDDLREVSPPAKIAGQVLAASVLYLLGVSLFYFRIPFAGFFVLSPDLAPLFTVLWVVAIANAINLIDGLDGLAAGIVAIASIAYFFYAYRMLEVGLIDAANLGPMLAAITAGICVGFLPHNFSPARIFMGDAGALLLGLLLASTTMVVGGRTADQFSGQTYFFFAPIVIPLVILGVPLIDTVFAIIRRTVSRKGLAQADKRHLHHRLMQLGHGPRRTVLLMWLWTAVLSAFVLMPIYTGRGNAVIPIGLFALAIGLYTLLRPGLGSWAFLEPSGSHAKARKNDSRDRAVDAEGTSQDGHDDPDGSDKLIDFKQASRARSRGESRGTGS